jgi:hypothetical protein
MALFQHGPDSFQVFSYQPGVYHLSLPRDFFLQKYVSEFICQDDKGLKRKTP